MSDFYIDQKYVGMVSTRLRNYKHKGAGNSLGSFTHKCERPESRKRRGYFLSYKGSVVFCCHNCGISCSLFNFLKEEDPNLYAEYRIETFREGNFIQQQNTKPEAEESKPVIPYFTGLIPYSKLVPTNPAMRYLTRRMIPEDKLDLFYMAPKFYSWAAQYDDVFRNFKEQVPRLVIPYYDEYKNLLGFACRAYGRESPKYIQLRIDKKKEFIFGADQIDLSKKIIAVEGQIDSVFLDNAVAMGTANYQSDYLKKYKDRVIIVPDNDFRRNIHVCNQLKKSINMGYTVCLLPEDWKKDINEIVKSGIDSPTIMNYILSNHRTGPAALLELTLEKKC